MRYVLDASAALCWVLPRPNSGKSLQLRDDFQHALHELLAPSVFPGEVASALTKAERQKLIPIGDARPLLTSVMRTPPLMHAYEPLLDRALTDRRTDYVNIHAARPGCFLCRVERPERTPTSLPLVGR